MHKPRPRIAVLGSINQDLVIRCGVLPRPGETVLAVSSSEVSGGKGANQAVAAARLGGDVRMIGRVGDDLFGERLCQGLLAENLDISLVWRTADCASGMAVVAVEDSGENSILVVPGANGRVTAIDVANVAEFIGASDILLLQLEIPLPAVAAAIEIANRNGVRTILNPAPASEQLPAEMFNVDLLCPNLAEAEVLIGQPIRSRQEALEAARQLTRRGAREVVITLGNQGAVVSDGQQTEWFPPFMVQAQDTTAAGDAFAGALAVRCGEGATLREAVRFASAAGAITVTRPGAQPALPTRNEVEAMLNSGKVE